MAARDILMISIVIFTVAFSFLIIHFVANTMTTALIDVESLNETEQFVPIMEGVENMTERMDYLGFGVFIALILGLVITGWFVGGNPLFMFVYFILVVMAVIISTIFDFVWDAISGASTFTTTLVSFPIMNHILSNLPMYMSIIGMVGLVVMFAKPYITGETQ